MKCWLTHNKSKLLLLAVVSVSAVVVLSTGCGHAGLPSGGRALRLLIRKKGGTFPPLFL